MTHAILILPLALIAIAAFVMFRSKTPSAPAMPPLPAALRTDLFFGYFHTFDNQAAETAEHVNIMFESGWFGAQATAASMKAHGKRTILCLSVECYDWADGAVTPRADAVDRMAATFSALRAAGVLGQVVALYPIDEPDLTGKSDSDILAMCAAVRSAARPFAVLAGVKLAVIYANKNTLPGMAAFDWVGLDDYPAREGVLASPIFTNLLAQMLPHQELILVPGGADPFRQDPEAFRRFAHSDPRVVGILAFMWARQYPGTLPGIGTNGMADKYRALGLELCARPNKQ
jgi:hypothetical protein